MSSHLLLEVWGDTVIEVQCESESGSLLSKCLQAAERISIRLLGDFTLLVGVSIKVNGVCVCVCVSVCPHQYQNPDFTSLLKVWGLFKVVKSWFKGY